MTLAALIRGRGVSESSALATAIPATGATGIAKTTTTVAKVATVAVANRPDRDFADDAPSIRGLLHFPDRDPLGVCFRPMASNADTLRAYPDAAAEPIADPPGTVIPPDVVALFNECEQASLYGDVDRASLPAMVAIDPGGTRALVTDMHARIGRCSRCRHFRKPGLTDGYCTGRDDLPTAYGLLRALPDDGGAWCSRFEVTQ